MGIMWKFNIESFWGSMGPIKGRVLSETSFFGEMGIVWDRPGPYAILLPQPPSPEILDVYHLPWLREILLSLFKNLLLFVCAYVSVCMFVCLCECRHPQAIVCMCGTCKGGKFFPPFCCCTAYPKLAGLGAPKQFSCPCLSGSSRSTRVTHAQH